MLNNSVLPKTSSFGKISPHFSRCLSSLQLFVILFFIASLVLLFPKNTYAEARLIKDQSDESAPATVRLAEEEIFAVSGGTVEVPISFYGSEYGITAAMLNVEFDNSLLEFDPRDYDGNGIPDSITFYVPDDWRVLAYPGIPNQEIELILFDNGASTETLPDGLIATVSLKVKASITAQAIGNININKGELIDSSGQTVAPTTSGTTVQVAVPTLNNLVYLPIIVQ